MTAPIPNKPQFVDGTDYASVAQSFLDSEMQWRRFVDRHYPGAACVHWSPWHKIYRHGNRAIKTQLLAALPEDASQHVEHEYSLLESIERPSNPLHPVLKEIEGRWAVLEMDWVDGELLDDLFRARRGREVSVFRLLGELWRISRSGVVHRQFRPRHVFRRRDGRLVLIDFGGSYRSSPLTAIRRNFALWESTGGRRHPSSFAVMLARCAFGFGDSPSDTQEYRTAAAAARSWAANSRRSREMSAEALRDNPGDTIAAAHFAAMEASLKRAIDIAPELQLETWMLQLGSYVLFGARSFGVLWERVSARVDFSGKRVVDCACGMGALAAVANLSGAKQVIVCDTSPDLLDAAQHFSQGLGANAAERCELANEIEISTLDRIPDADILAILSPRTDALPLDAVLDCFARYSELLIETRNPADVLAGLARRGFCELDELYRSYADRSVIYAARRGTSDAR